MKKIIMVMAVIVTAVFVAGSVFAFGGCGYSDKGDKDNGRE